MKAGVFVAAAGALLILAGVAGWVEADQVRSLANFAVLGGLGLLALGFLLEALSRTGSVLARPRCPRCRRPVRKGAIYCPDHLKETLAEARDKYHDEHGSGI